MQTPQEPDPHPPRPQEADHRRQTAQEEDPRGGADSNAIALNLNLWLFFK